MNITDLPHAVLRTSGYSGKHIMMRGFVYNGLIKIFFKRFSTSYHVAQGNFGGIYEIGAQSSIGG
jgi:hypothetical protein